MLLGLCFDRGCWSDPGGGGQMPQGLPTERHPRSLQKEAGLHMHRELSGSIIKFKAADVPQHPDASRRSPTEVSGMSGIFNGKPLQTGIQRMKRSRFSLRRLLLHKNFRSFRQKFAKQVSTNTSLVDFAGANKLVRHFSFAGSWQFRTTLSVVGWLARVYQLRFCVALVHK